MSKGIDVSVYQGNIDWRAVASTGEVDFTYVRASIGLSVDVKFKQNWTSLKGSSILRGAYHFFKMELDPVKQADMFFNTVGPLDDRDLPPTIDVEVHRLTGDTATTYVKKLLQFIVKAEELFNRRIVIYTGGPIFNESTTGADPVLLDAIATHDLWLSAYVVDPTKWVPTAWKSRGRSWTIWQKSGDIAAGGKPGMRIKGIASVVDYNVTQGSAADVDLWVKKSFILNESSDILVGEPPRETVIEPVHVEPDAPRTEPQPLVVVSSTQQSGFFAIIVAFFRMIIMLFSKRG